MKTIDIDNVPYFQGDLMIMRLAALPATARPSPETPVDGLFHLAHSETGHHHVIDSRAARLLIDEINDFIAYLEVLSPAEVRHLRDYDTHEPYLLTPGVYELRREQVEYGPAGWQRAAD